MRRPAPIPAGPRARAARGAAFYLVLASLWIIASDQLLSFLVRDPGLLAGIGMAKGIFFVVVTTLLLYVLLVRLDRRVAAGKAASGQRGVVLTFLILAALVPLAGSGIVRLQEPRFEEIALNDLHAISDLKANQVESWLQEWRADADVLMASAEFAEDVERWRSSGDARARQSMLGIIESFENVHRYEVHVLDTDGHPLLPDATRPYQLEEPHRTMLPAAMQTRQLQTSDLYRDTAGRIRYDLAVPLIRRIAGEPHTVGVAVIRAPVEQFLFPLIQTWPTPSPSGETVLVRREGDHVLFLNELRHRRDTALSFRLPIGDHPRLPAAIGLQQGHAAMVRDGIDYRGVPVLAVVRPIRGTSWHLVTKLDRDEVQAPLRQLIWWVSLLALVAVACVAVAVVMLWRQQQRANRLQLEAQAAGKDRLLKLFYDLPFMGMAMTSPSSKRFLYVNDGLCSMLGYGREELLAMTWMEIVHPDDLQGLSEPSERLLGGEIESIDAEVRCLCKEGGCRIVDVDVRGARGPDGHVDVVVIVAQDITEKREAMQALAKREREFHTLADNVPDNIVRYDLDGRVRYVNRALERTVGIPASTLIGSFARDTAPDGRFDGLEAAVQRVGMTGRGEEFEQIVPGPDGQPRYHLISIVPEPGTDGAPVSVLAVGRDLTELKLADERTRQAATVFESTRESVVIADLDGNMLAVNKAFTDITGYSEAEALGRNPRILKSGRQGPEFYQSMWNTLLATGQWQGEVWNRRKNGEVYPAWMTISTVRDERGRATHYVCVTTDISQIKRSEEQLAHLAHYDPLTDLPNRLLLQSRLAHAIDRAARRGQRAAVLFIDLDRFKTVNDSLGHVVGDQLLVDASRRLAKRVRDEDTLGRFGGDEFLLVLEPIEQPEDAASVARDLLATLVAPFHLASDNEVYIGASIGIAVYPDDSTDAADLLRDADAAMYQAKEHGRNRFCFYTADMNANAIAQLELEAALRRAVERGEFVLHYQPKADLRTGQVFGAEALIRWQPEGQEMVPPGRFISLAEKTGLIVPIGNWVIDDACRQLRAWHDEGMRELRLAVNVSGRQFHSGDLPAVVAEALARHEVDPGCLELELTESILMDDPEQTIAILQDLKRIGVKLSLDDFGTGYSSFAYLSRFPIDALKIDQSFVRNIVTEPQAAMIAVSIIDLAHRLRLRVVAEGVETEAQLGYLRQRDCDEMQGYLFSRPLPLEAFETLLYQGRSLQLGPRDAAPDGRTLLLVDDEPNILSALQRLLRREGYRILTADCAARGLELLAMHPVQVIVSDQRMPGMTGTEFLTRVKDLHPDTVRMVLTGYTDLESVTQAVNGGAIYKFLAKPWNDGQLREHVRDAFLYHEAIIKPRAAQQPG